MKAVVLADNHTDYDFETPEGDLLIHCGDFTFHGNPKEMEKFKNYLKEQPHKHKLFIFGNHEKIDKKIDYWRKYLEEETGAICIHEKEYVIDNLKFYGSSYTPKYMNYSFMQDDKTRKEYWKNMRTDMDVLVTHGPPMNIMSKIEDGTEIGCEYLKEFVYRVKPKYHFFGHNHAGAGVYNNDDTLFINAAILTEHYKKCRPPIVVNL